VVDDNEDVLAVVDAIPETARFEVLSAWDGPRSVKVAHETKGTIDLLLSGVGHGGDVTSGPVTAPEKSVRTFK
jgi:hypothetical protein